MLRRRWPLGVLAVTWRRLVYAAHTYGGPSQRPVYPALWTVALTLPRRTAWLAATVTAVAVAAAVPLRHTMFDGEPLYAAVTMFAAMWWGEAVRARRAYVAERGTGPSGPSPGRGGPPPGRRGADADRQGAA